MVEDLNFDQLVLTFADESTVRTVRVETCRFA